MPQFIVNIATIYRSTDVLVSPHLGVTQRPTSLRVTHETYQQCLDLETECLVCSNEVYFLLGMQALPQIAITLCKGLLKHGTAQMSSSKRTQPTAAFC